MSSSSAWEAMLALSMYLMDLIIEKLRKTLFSFDFEVS
jgi:hypothetical protein